MPIVPPNTPLTFNVRRYTYLKRKRRFRTDRCYPFWLSLMLYLPCIAHLFSIQEEITVKAFGKTLMFILALGISNGASAAMFKCVGSDGKTNYQEQPCSASSTEKTLKTGGYAWTDLPPLILGERDMRLSVDYDSVRSVGPYKRVTYKQTEKDGSGQSPYPILLFYIYYDCASKRFISGPPSRKDPDETSFDPLQHKGESRSCATAAQFPYCSPQVIAKVCGK